MPPGERCLGTSNHTRVALPVMPAPVTSAGLGSTLGTSTSDDWALTEKNRRESVPVRGCRLSASCTLIPRVATPAVSAARGAGPWAPRQDGYPQPAPRGAVGRSTRTGSKDNFASCRQLAGKFILVFPFSWGEKARGPGLSC